MSTYQNLIQAVEEYVNNYRHPEMQKYTIGPLYDLRSSEEEKTPLSELKWPDTWPNCHNAGIYAIIDSGMNVLYIGKSSMQGSVGGRLSSYFGYKDDRSCKIKHEPYWSTHPRFVWTLAVPESTRFEAPSLEEYLIKKLQPSDNIIGRSPPSS